MFMKTITDVTVISNEEINMEINTRINAIQKITFSKYKTFSDKPLVLLGELSVLLTLTGVDPEDDDRYILLARLLNYKYGAACVPLGKELES